MSVIENERRDSQYYLEQVRELRHFDGAPTEFWPKLLDAMGHYAVCQELMLFHKDVEKNEWRRLGAWPKSALNLRRDSPVVIAATDAAERAISDQIVIDEDVTPEGRIVLGFYLDLGDGQPPVSMVFCYDARPHEDLKEFAQKLQLLVDIPVFYQFSRMLQQARSDVVQFADTIDLMTLLNECDRFMSAAMTFCNELATRHEADRVSLGWLDGGYIRVQAISHMEKFEKKMVAVQMLEAAMEESFDQDEEVVWPAAAESTGISRDHEKYAQEQGPGHLVSLPIHIDGEGIGVVTLERKNRAFDEDEIRGLRLVVDQASRHLSQLKRYDRWFGARFKTWLKEKLADFLGVDHTFAKALGILGALLLAFLLFGWLPYRVEAPFILRTEETVYVPAPIDGYVKEVLVDVGEHVSEGQPLLNLDTRELLLEEAMSLADITRYTREMEKARAQNQLADMRIAEALMAQSRAELEKVRYHLQNATLAAPFDGIVVEGDLKEMLGAPVRKGDVLFRVADIDEMYVELDLPERDIHEVSMDNSGEIAFVSRPESSFPIRIVEIDPAAVTKEAGNVFVLKGELEGEVQPWWRPGMSGVAKVDVGSRNVLWILTHRTIDFFRLLLWW